MTKLKYKKINSLEQYTEYCNIHEQLIIEDDEKYFDEIELLEVLIEDYDNRLLNNQFKQLNPVELLRTMLENNNLSQVIFAKKIDVSRQLINDILNYHRNISKDLVVKFSNFFSMRQEAFSRKYDLKAERMNKGKRKKVIV